MLLCRRCLQEHARAPTTAGLQTNVQGRLPTHLLCGMLPEQLLSSASSTVTT